MKFSGKITQIGEKKTTGSGKETMEIVVEEIDETTQYPNSLSFALFDTKVSLIEGFGIGSIVDVMYSAKAKEYNGRYFNTLSARRIIGEKMTKAPEKADKITPPDDDVPF